MKNGGITSARDQLAKDVRDLRAHTGAPNTAWQDLIELNKTLYRELRE